MSCSLFCCEDIQSLPRLWTVRRALRFRGLWGKEFYTPCYIARKQARHLEDNVKSHARVARVRRRASEGESHASDTCKETRERG